MPNRLYDNSQNLKLVEAVRELAANPSCNHIMIATGYWDLPGTRLIYDELKSFFARDGKLQLLIGQEPTLQYNQVNRDNHKFPDFYIQRDINALNSDYTDTARLIIDNARTDANPEGQFEIRVYGQGEHKEFLHAKCYIFLGEALGTGIIGSSNFTQKGLEGNAELNYLEENANCVTAPISAYSTSKSHKVWFEEKWECSQPWTGEFITNILEPSPVGQRVLEEKKEDAANPQLTSYEVYIKYLQMQFGDMLDAKTSSILQTYLPKTVNPLAYQLDAAKQCYSIMKRHGGFLLGDVVGLGKTVVAVLLIRHFLEHAKDLECPNKVLIVTPPAIKAGWERTIENFDTNPKNKIAEYVTYVTTGSIDKLVDDEPDGDDDILSNEVNDKFGLIIIDESHNFRNKNTLKYQALDALIDQTNPYVGLLSATPQNNAPNDLYHQILLFQRQANNSTLPGVPGGKLDTFFSEQQKKFLEARSMPQTTPQEREAARKKISEVSQAIRDAVLNDLVVRRTRTDIKKMYPADAGALKFPTVQGPHKLQYNMSPALQRLFNDTIEAISPTVPATTRHLGFHRYAAIAQLKNAEDRKVYEKNNLTVNDITQRLQHIMQLLLIKRLESSKSAFITSLKNLRRYNNVMIDMLNHDCVYICPDIDINKLHQEANGNFNEFKQKVEAKPKFNKKENRRFTAADFDPNYLADLQADKVLIEELIERWESNNEDPKFDRFKQAVKPELFDPAKNNPSGTHKQRLVIFTEAIDTQEQIAAYLKDEGYNVLTISAENRDKDQQIIEENFDANCPAERRCDDYNVIVTTEVLAEGVNLHRANVILNYDTPWNATRLMQRIGRVNRIGSVEDFVHVFNFFPSQDGNNRIHLIENAYAKIQSFHEMFGEDNKVFTEDEELTEVNLQSLADGEESPFAPFINDLIDYRKAHYDRYEFISKIKPTQLGGRLTGIRPDKSVFVFADDSGRLTSLSVDANTSNADVISTLQTMGELKCGANQMFDMQFTLAEDNALLRTALDELHRHTVHYTTARELNRAQNTALEKLRKLLNDPNLTEEIRNKIMGLSRLVRDKYFYVIKTINEANLEEPTLFGTDQDINDIVNAAFGHLTARAQARRGSQNLAIYEIK